MSVADAPSRGRYALVCFDFEGRWGMPFTASYDLESSTHRILEVLARHEAHATFFAVGALAIERPDLIGAIFAAGHEIAVHGPSHERIKRSNAGEIVRLGQGLDESGAAIAAVTGALPTGFRAPHLLAPRFYDPGVYELLAERGYRWASNRELRHVVEVFRPDRIRSDRAWRRMQSHPALLAGTAAQALQIALNANLFLRNRVPVGSPLRWLRDGCPPFRRGEIVEIPLYGPMDCDLLGFPNPASTTPRSLMDYARFALRSGVGHARKLLMLTFHDWIVTGAGRIELLDSTLEFLTSAGVAAVSVRDVWPHLLELSSPAR
jgi:peptidoglycan/xylan/chitin deacetylase (PgdA/CDA1 family)